MRNWAIGLTILAAPLLGFPAIADHEAGHVDTGKVAIEDAYVVETAPSAKSAVGYATIINTGDGPDRLVEVRGDYPRVELHTTEMQNEVASMMPVASVTIEPGQSVTMEPGGLHIMFMGLEQPFKVGETITATLVFEAAGEVEVMFPVEPRRENGHIGH